MNNLSTERIRHPKPPDFVPEIYFSDDHPKWAGKPRCQSWSPNKGRQCEAICVTHKKRCQAHGGLTPNGLASPHTKHGLYSKYLPAKLSTQYQELLDLGQDLFRLDDETSIVTTLISQQLERLESGESGAAWQQLSDIYGKAVIIAQKPNKSPEDVLEFNALFVEIGAIIDGGAMAFAARREATQLIEQKRRLVNDERRDMAAKHQAMSFDRVMLILTAFVHSFKMSLEKHVDNDKDRRLVLSDTQTFLDKVISE